MSGKKGIGERLRELAGACLCMARADGEVSDEEVLAICQQVHLLGGDRPTVAGTDGAIREGFEMVARGRAEDLVDTIARRLDDAARRHVLAATAAVMVADGAIEPEEHRLYRRLSRAFGIPAEAAEALVEEARPGPDACSARNAETARLLRSEELEPLMEGIRRLREHGERGWLTAGGFDALCRIFEPDRHSFPDLLRRTREVLQLLVENKVALAGVISDIRGAWTYMANLIEGRYDPSGWAFLSCSANLAVFVDFNQNREAIRSAAPKPLPAIEAYGELMRAVESRSHDAYWMIRGFGDRFVPQARRLVVDMRAESVDMLLHAYDDFKGDDEVVDLMRATLRETRKDHWLHERVATYLANVTGRRTRACT